MTSAIDWQDAPPEAVRPRRRSGGKYADAVQALRANPGKTARLLRDAKDLQTARNIAGTIERGVKKGFEPAGAFEARAAENSDGTASVWVTFVGDPDGDGGDAED